MSAYLSVCVSVCLCAYIAADGGCSSNGIIIIISGIVDGIGIHVAIIFQTSKWGDAVL
jgi:hypothetical protein